MKKILSLALCLAAMNLVGCAKAGLKNVDPSWTEAPSAVTVVFTEPAVKNTDDVADDLPEFASNFSGWFAQQMSSEFNKQAGLTPKIEVKESNLFTMTPTAFGKKTFNIPSPDYDQLGVSDGFLISIANIDVSRISETKMTGPTSAETRNYLQFTGEYSIANASEKKIVTSGTFKTRVTLGFAMSTGDWVDNMENLVEEIIKDTPLQKK